MLRLLPVLIVVFATACSAGPVQPPVPTATIEARVQTVSTPVPVVPTATAAPTIPTDPSFAASRAMLHIQALVDNLGPRYAGSPAYTSAAEYAERTLRSYGYIVTRQPFTFEETETRRESVTTLGANPRTIEGVALTNTASGTVEGGVVDAGLGRPADFKAANNGAIALVARGGGITFIDKVQAAVRAGAKAVIISNNEPGMFRGSLSSAVDIPVIAISQEEGDAFRRNPSQLRIDVEVVKIQIASENVIAVRPGGPENIVIGGHLDSVRVAPGANDNASGSATVLELARALAAKPTSFGLRFILFGAEENGLIGSQYYVRSLSAQDKSSIRAMINLDMVGVGNRFLIGGDASIVTPLRDAATSIGQETGTMNNDLMGASDHASFRRERIPASFLYWTNDPDYHQPTDVTKNIRPDLLQITGDTVIGALAQLENG